MELLELDIVLTKKLFILAETIQKLSFREPASSPTHLRRRHTLRLVLNAVCAGKLAVTPDFTLLTEHAREDSLWLRCLGERGM